ncbi:Arginyl-tRNA--protein transferase 1 [Boothiomyces sp. JEL0866]|nr:Arginyl-tRNA--protein transferase 1 [Boothiomyces sp. JEL0866]
MFSITYLHGNSSHECGYCRSEAETSKSFGVLGFNLSVENYQLMIDKGWRRSGNYIYKPNIAETCCPQYSIKLDCLEFQPTKSQSKVLKKVQKYLLSGELKPSDRAAVKTDASSIPSKKVSTDYIQPKLSAPVPNPSFPKEIIPAPTIQKQPKPVLSRKSGIENLVETIENNPANKIKMQIKLEPAEYTKESHDLYIKYQIAIHGDKLEDLTSEKFKNFLIDSPFQTDTQFSYKGELYHCGLYHQKYYVDGTLIAIAVIDILPQCLSSVYFLYDPHYSSLSLGTFSAFKEIATTLELYHENPSIHHYYLGYYIHTCPKMRYKAQYRPSQLLCPLGFNWVKADIAIPLLETKKNSVLTYKENDILVPKSISEFQKPQISPNALKMVKILQDRKIVPLDGFISNKSFIMNLKQFIELLGPEILQSILIIAPE